MDKKVVGLHVAGVFLHGQSRHMSGDRRGHLDGNQALRVHPIPEKTGRSLAACGSAPGSRSRDEFNACVPTESRWAGPPGGAPTPPEIGQGGGEGRACQRRDRGTPGRDSCS